jgi:hypothetical protein
VPKKRKANNVLIFEVVGCHPYAPAAFTPRINLVLIFLEAELTPGHMELSDATEKTPATPGIDPGTFRLLAQYLNHYAIPGPNMHTHTPFL